MTTWRCPICGRDKFDRSYQPHNCVGGFRKKLLPFEQHSQEDDDTDAALRWAGSGAEEAFKDENHPR